MNIPRHLRSLPLLVVPPISTIQLVPDAPRVVLGIEVILIAAFGIGVAYYHRDQADLTGLHDASLALDAALKQNDDEGVSTAALALSQALGSVGNDIRKQLVCLTLWVAAIVVAYLTSLWYWGVWAYSLK